MKLVALKLTYFKGEKNEWSLEGKTNEHSDNSLFLGAINLIVGKNASGKSRTVDAIRHLADLFSGDAKISSLHRIGLGTAEYQVKFEEESNIFEYFLNFKKGKIFQEILLVDEVEKLNREKGTLWYEEANNMLKFKTDDDILAISKRDQIQHPFFEKLYNWGNNLNHYRFGRQLGKNALLREIPNQENEEIDLKDGDDVTNIFVKAKKEFPNSFVNTLLEDMKAISYHLQDIGIGLIKNFPIPAYGLNVKEKDLTDMTDQREMSQGMFRAFSLLIQLNYSLLSKIPSCILIDDIGEGLDYERSTNLIDLIIKKVKDSNVQVIMTTNDRFVMNNIPLEYWMVIQRLPHKALFYTYQNSKETFDDFKYTGLNNFDFLSSEFYITGFNNLPSQ